MSELEKLMVTLVGSALMIGLGMIGCGSLIADAIKSFCKMDSERERE